MTLTPQTAKELVEAAKEAHSVAWPWALKDKPRLTYGEWVAVQTRLRRALSQAEKEMEGVA